MPKIWFLEVMGTVRRWILIAGLVVSQVWQVVLITQLPILFWSIWRYWKRRAIPTIFIGGRCWKQSSRIWNHCWRMGRYHAWTRWGIFMVKGKCFRREYRRRLGLVPLQFLPHDVLLRLMQQATDSLICWVEVDGEWLQPIKYETICLPCAVSEVMVVGGPAVNFNSK